MKEGTAKSRMFSLKVLKIREKFSASANSKAANAGCANKPTPRSDRARQPMMALVGAWRPQSPSRNAWIMSALPAIVVIAVKTLTANRKISAPRHELDILVNNDEKNRSKYSSSMLASISAQVGCSDRVA